MISQILSLITPDMIVQEFAQKPEVLQQFLNKFSIFKSLGTCLSKEQQVFTANNAQHLEKFLSTQAGKDATGLWIDEFIEYVKKYSSN